MKRTLIGKLKENVGKEVTVDGWVNIRRDHGKLIFLDIRDRSGTIQAVALPSHAEAHAIAQKVRNEWVLQLSGIVNKRPEKMVNKDTPNGDIEMEITTITVLNQADTPAFDISTDGYDVDEEVRLKYRYLDLRRERLQKNLRKRHEVFKFIRDYLSEKGFIEVETPILTKSTPEGARDYVVPSRIDQGKFYALPQSPQQYKQLLMSSGTEKYFQIAKCFRDEDTRGDRQPEFTQLDMEVSFPTEEEIMNLNEELLTAIVEKLFPDKTIQEKPFPRISYKESLEKYGNDCPDLRSDKNDPNLLSFAWVVDFPLFEKDKTGKWTFSHNPFSAPKEGDKKFLLSGEKLGEVKAAQYDVVLSGMEIGGGSIRSHEAEVLQKVFEIIGYEKSAVEKNFGHMLSALRSGTPPHGGIAWGLDRLMSILLNEPNIRETIAFPKTGEGRDPMMNAPSEISDEQMKELGLGKKKK